MKRIFYFLLAGLLTVAACNKEMPGVAGQDVEPAAQQECTVTLRIGSGKTLTKAHSSADYPLDDGLQRIDVYTFYYYKNTDCSGHIVLTPDESGVTVLELREEKDQQMGILVIGNLDPDTAAYFEGKSTSTLYNNCRIMFSAGNFAPDAIPCIASKHLTFSTDMTVEMPLMRVMCRIDLGNIKVDWDDEDLLGKEVWVRNICIGNATNSMPVLLNTGFSSSDIYGLHFGSAESELAGNAFGGRTTGFRNRINSYATTVNSSYYFYGTGKMNATYPAVMNKCYKKDKGVMTMDASDSMYEATVQNYNKSSGQGKIVNSGDMTLVHTFAVNKSFYAIWYSVDNPGDIICDYDAQLATQKLIIEMEVDGETLFYPIELTDTQPNTVYQISNVTLKKKGSAYSNFYEKRYAADVSVSVVDWDEIPIANWNLGVDPETGEPVAQ